jgi:hypothetical protein
MLCPAVPLLPLLLLLLLLACLRKGACAAGGRGGIRVGVDRSLIFGYDGLTAKLNSSGLFEFHVAALKDMPASYFLDDVDMVLIDKPILYHKYFDKFSSKPPSLALASLDILEKWDNKKFFKLWLRDIGMGAYIAPAVNSSNATFPCILKIVGLTSKKDHATSGKTVYLIYGVEQMDTVIKEEVDAKNFHKAPGNKVQYFLEEPLVGPHEGTLYGSVYGGELLSLRCFVRTTYVGSSVYRVLDKGKFTIHSVPCGSILSRHAGVIAREAAYTGVFCMNFKMQADMRHPYYLENNPRICGTHVRNSGLFISSYLPLAFAIQRTRGLFNASCAAWYTDASAHSILHWIVHLEQRIAITGDSPLRSIMGIDWAHRIRNANIDFNVSDVVPRSHYFIDRDSNPLSLQLLLDTYSKERQQIQIL